MTLDSLKSIPTTHPVIRHPFLEAFAQGQLSVPQVTYWVEQQFYFSISLPDAFAALYARIPDIYWQEKRQLVELIKVEAWGSKTESDHSHYFLELCDFLQIDISHLTQQTPKPYTSAYLQHRIDACLDRTKSISDGLACIAVGNELLNLFFFKSYRQGVTKIPGLEECPTGYFDAHLADEQKDFLIFSRLFDLTTKTKADVESARRAVLHLLEQRSVFFDALYSDLRSQ